jgi:hypothetical protein
MDYGAFSKMAKVYKYWQSLASGKNTPHTQTINSCHILEMMFDLFIVERLCDAKIRFRFLGSSLGRKFADKESIKTLGDLLANYAKHTLD